MLHILFLILKIIGIILLIILGIALTLVGVVLFVPIRYRLKTETTNGMDGLRTEARATWLFHLISAYATYQEKELDWQVRVGWKKFRATEKDVSIKEDDGIMEKAKEDNSGEESTTHKETSSSQEAVKIGGENTDKDAASKEKKENWFKKIKCTIQRFCDKIKNIKEFLMEETHIQAFLRLKKELVFFLTKIKPDKMKGYIRFGLEDPYNTGRVLALFSVLYPFYGEDFQIYPEFEQEIVEGDVFFKGRLHLSHLLAVVCRLYFDRNIKTAYKNFKNIKG